MDTNKVLKFLNLEGLMDHFSGYIEDRVELLKLDFQEDAIRISVKLFLIFLMILFAAFFLLFVSIALAILLNKALDHGYFGYLIMAGIYLLLTLIIYSLRNNETIRDEIYKNINKS